MAQRLHCFYVNALRIAYRRATGRLDLTTKGSIMRDYKRWTVQITKVLLVIGLGLIAGTRPVRAQASLSGTYNCISVEVAGKAHACTAPSIEMNSDGSYQILSERGTYEILKGHWLVLSPTKNRSRARLDGSREIIFEFVSGGKKSKITYRRKYQRPPAWVSG